MASTLLVSGKNEVEVFAVVDGIEDGENGTARVADWEMFVSVTDFWLNGETRAMTYRRA
jgi:hypothetical protein